MQTLAVIGGSGIYGVPGLKVLARQELDTPFGVPSGPIVEGMLGDTRLLFLARHGEGHRLLPHEVNYRANICALTLLGATQVVSLSAVGSMKEEIEPGHVVIVDQYMDFTKSRISTFFGDGIAAHVGFADPVCANLAEACALASLESGAVVHRGGTYLCMEGPQFSTRAESQFYRSFGVSVIGMTAMPEAKLAREAQLPYATIAFATDYDCWHESEADVSVEAVLAVLSSNGARAQNIIAQLPSRLPDPGESLASGALTHAIITSDAHLSDATRERLAWLLTRRSRQD